MMSVDGFDGGVVYVVAFLRYYLVFLFFCVLCCVFCSRVVYSYHSIYCLFDMLAECLHSNEME
jgi:hypothetical protein